MSALIGRSINMSKITEVNTGAAATAELICPLMSGQIVPVPGRAGRIDTPGATTLAPSVVTCAREKCQWWNQFGGQCAIQAIAEGLVVVSGSLSSVRDVLEPATESPLVRIADSLDQISKRLNKIEMLFKLKHDERGF